MNAESPSAFSGPLLFLSLETRDIPPHGVDGVLIAERRERAAVARELDLEEIASLAMEYDLLPLKSDRFRLKGRVKAAVTQLCVITLEPVESNIDEPFEIELWPQEDVEKFEAAEDDDGAALSLDGPEPIVNGRIDIGQLAYEHFAAALDPYPRKAGVEFEWRDPHADADTDNGAKPFAELENLMRKKDKATRKTSTRLE